MNERTEAEVIQCDERVNGEVSDESEIVECFEVEEGGCCHKAGGCKMKRRMVDGRWVLRIQDTRTTSTEACTLASLRRLQVPCTLSHCQWPREMTMGETGHCCRGIQLHCHRSHSLPWRWRPCHGS